MVKDKKKKLSSEGSSTRDKMLARKKKLESRGNGGGLVYPKEGTLRMRIKSPGDDQELGTHGRPCRQRAPCRFPRGS